MPQCPYDKTLLPQVVSSHNLRAFISGAAEALRMMRRSFGGVPVCVTSYLYLPPRAFLHSLQWGLWGRAPALSQSSHLAVSSELLACAAPCPACCVPYLAAWPAPLTCRDGLPAGTLCVPRTKGGGVATALPEEQAGWKRKNQKESRGV